MKKVILLISLLLVFSCGIRHTPSTNTTQINGVNFSELNKESQRCAYGLLWFPPFAGSNISVVKVARENYFKKVSLVDYQSDFYILFNRSCVIVYGE